MAAEPSPDVVIFRLESLERDRERINDRLRTVDQLDERVAGLVDDFKEFRDEIRANFAEETKVQRGERIALITAAGTLSGAVIYAITQLLAH